MASPHELRVAAIVAGHQEALDKASRMLGSTDGTEWVEALANKILLVLAFALFQAMGVVIFMICNRHNKHNATA